MNNDKTRRVVEILLVEDNPGDVRLIEEAFKEGKIKNNINVVEDGVEAVKYLKKEDKYSHSIRPDLILLDLNLPKMDGREVLKIIKYDDQLKRIPIVILTTSDAEEDILKTYNTYANCFITKPIDLYDFIHVVQYIEDFWFTVVKLPTEFEGV